MGSYKFIKVIGRMGVGKTKRETNLGINDALN